MNPRIAIVDYGMGNLRSVEKALEAVGGNAVVTDSPAALKRADAVVLPGVGAFGEAVRRLQRNKLWAPIESTLENGKPFLGICLGLQMLFETSEESPRIKGFGFLKGSVVRFCPAKKDRLKVPHIGWNSLRRSSPNRSPWASSLRSGDHYYFVHSYFPSPTDPSVVAASSVYGEEFCAAGAGEHWVATQFHPEKSGDQGLRLLRHFVNRVKRVTC